MYLLEPTDLQSNKSFYGKAKVISEGNKLLLKSYDTIVAEYDTISNEVTLNGMYSATTTRHIIAFVSSVLEKPMGTIGELRELSANSSNIKASFDI